MMQPEQIKRMAQGVLAALNDERSMTPTQYSNSLADLKQVMMGLMTGSLVIEMATRPVQPQPQPHNNGVDDNENVESH